MFLNWFYVFKLVLYFLNNGVMAMCNVSIDVNRVDENLLKNKLKDRKITVIADAAGVSRSTIYKWLHDKQPISAKTAAKLVNYLLST